MDDSTREVGGQATGCRNIGCGLMIAVLILGGLIGTILLMGTA